MTKDQMISDLIGATSYSKALLEALPLEEIEFIYGEEF